MLQDAIVRCIEVIGEAARLVSDTTCSYAPHIPWSLITGMRNVLAHEYGAIDLDEVYAVVTIHLPPLLIDLEQLIGDLEKMVDWNE